MQNGELDGFKAKLIVMMLGTNNINRNPNDEIAEGDRMIIEEFKKRQPQAKVLLLGIFAIGTAAVAPIDMQVADRLQYPGAQENRFLRTAATGFTYPVHRQMFPARAACTSSSVGSGCSERNA